MPRYPEEIEREREKWRKFPRKRPARIVIPGPGQESVWDYPRPPRVEAVSDRVRVEFGGIILAESFRAFRVLETSSPPVYYLAPEDVRMECLRPSEGSSFCEWKGRARYWAVRVKDRVADWAAWSYPDPDPDYGVIKDYLAFYPGEMDACYIGARRVTPQPGHYYGGWITPEVVGPFKGEPGSEEW